MVLSRLKCIKEDIKIIISMSLTAEDVTFLSLTLKRNESHFKLKIKYKYDAVHSGLGSGTPKQGKDRRSLRASRMAGMWEQCSWWDAEESMQWAAKPPQGHLASPVSNSTSQRVESHMPFNGALWCELVSVWSPRLLCCYATSITVDVYHFNQR